MKNKIKGFTLAEVLVTLAIIGVVASLTIASVVTKYQKSQFYTQFMKTYNTISTAFSMSQNENGFFDTWGIKNANQEQINNILNNYIKKYYKVAKTCDLTKTPDNCGLDELTVKALNMEGSTNYKALVNGLSGTNGTSPFVLQDGTIIAFTEFDYDSESDWTDIFIDTNGVKGPNTLGRDIFLLIITKVDNKYKLTASGLAGNHEIAPAKTAVTSNSYEEAMEAFNDNGSIADPDENDPLCTTERKCYGFYCAGRLLLQHKMDY